MVKKNKIVAVVLAVAVFFATLLSVNVIARVVEHECTDNSCQVCQEIESARQSLKALTSGILATAIALALIYINYQFTYCFAQPLLQGSLVALKVELLN